jgi:hypothetical protein
MNTVIAFLLSLSLSLFLCADREIPDPYWLPNDNLVTPEQVTPAAMKEDLLVLREILKKAYLGQQFFSKEMVPVFQKLNKFRPTEAMPTREFCQKIRIILEELPDQWVQIRSLSPRDLCGTMMRVYQATSGKNLAAQLRKKWLIKKTVIRDKSYYVVAITDKITPDDDFSKALSSIPYDAPIILDLREIGPLLSLTSLTPFLPEPFQKKVYQQGNTWSQLLLLWRKKIQLQLTEHMGLKNRATVVEEIQQLKNNLQDRSYSVRQEIWSGQNIFRGPLWIIVDETCFRRCEDFLSALSNRPQLTIVGQKTPGETHFDPPELAGALLPHSRLYLQINLIYGELPRQQWIERVGLTPHWLTYEREDAWKKLRQRLQQKPNPLLEEGESDGQSERNY